VLPSALNNAAIAFSMGNFAQAADPPAEEIAKARDDARNALQIGLCLYEAHKWIYGTEAFGLRLAAWVARKAPDAVVDGLILLVMRLRKVPDAILPSEQIAEMAKEALAVWKVSKRLEWLWRHDPHYKQILDPKRIRAAFADHIMLKLRKEEVKAAGMRSLPTPPGSKSRDEGGALTIRNGFTHYPQKQETDRFFKGELTIPPRIIMLDGSGSISFDVLSWLS
jgi:hypothetical protein